MPSKNWKLKDKKGNHFIMLLYLDNYFLVDYDKYTRISKSFIDIISNICALGSTVFNLEGFLYWFL